MLNDINAGQGFGFGSLHAVGAMSGKTKEHNQSVNGAFAAAQQEGWKLDPITPCPSACPAADAGEWL
ncbi:MAG TPA: hypothetical protein PL033_10295 [Candidatus Brocadiia bacterium]|nr:hypothetical protein [Candidatus Brocadiia bacterium]